MLTLNDLRTLKNDRDRLIIDLAEKLTKDGLKTSDMLVEVAYTAKLSTAQIKRILTLGGFKYDKV